MQSKLQEIKTNNDEITRSQEIAQSSSQLLLFFVNDILDFAQIRSRKLKKVIRSFSIREALNEIIKITEYKAIEKQITVKTDFGIDPCGAGQDGIKAEDQEVIDYVITDG